MKALVGSVVSIAGTQTAVVKVDSFIVHPKYKKRLARSQKFLVHDEVGVAVGNKVSFSECRPLSKMKRWRIVEVQK